MSKLARGLIDLWRGAGLAVRRPARREAVQAFEARHGVALPADLRGYFLAVDGMEDELGPGLNRFLPLDMVRPVEEELTDSHEDRFAYPGCFVFADHCIGCFLWAVRLGGSPAAESGPVFRVTCGSPPGGQVAPSFAAFVAMYLEDADSVL